jgi:hypothetical protein
LGAVNWSAQKTLEKILNFKIDFEKFKQVKKDKQNERLQSIKIEILMKKKNIFS